MKIREYRTLLKTLLNADADRDSAFRYYQRIFHNEWALPEGMGLYDYMHKVTDHSPHDAILAGVRVLTGNPLKLKVMPALANVETKAKANEQERVLRWQLIQANRRRTSRVENDIALSALLYGAVALNVVDLDWQIAQAKNLKADTRKMEAAKRYGRFMVNTYNPRDIHVMRSSYGVEWVALVQNRLASEIAAEWGDGASRELRDLAKEGKWVKYVDCMGYDERCVWCEPVEAEGKEIVLFSPADHGLKFMPWVALMGGLTLEEAEVDKYHPMLYPLFKTGAWETLNILSTLAATEAVVQAFKKDKVVDSSQDVEQDFTDPDGVMRVPPGVTVQQLAKQPLDPAKMEMVDRLKQNIQRATVPSVLQGGDLPSGVPFAGLNLYTQTAMGALKPPKDLSEQAMAEMFTLMLLWTYYSDTPMVARGGLGSREAGAGEVYSIPPEEINPDEIYIQVELTPQLPIDKMQQVNVATLLKQLGYPNEYALEDIGVEDPAGAIRSRIGRVAHADDQLLHLGETHAAKAGQREFHLGPCGRVHRRGVGHRGHFARAVRDGHV